MFLLLLCAVRSQGPPSLLFRQGIEFQHGYNEARDIVKTRARDKADKRRDSEEDIESL